MANPRYQYGTSPRKVLPEQYQQPVKRKQKVEHRPKLKVTESVPRQEVKVSRDQRKKQVKLTAIAILGFAVLLAIGYQNSQINVKFNEMQEQKKELAALEKENEQLNVSIENNLNLSNIEKEAKEQLGMTKLTNRQTVYINLPKKDYVEAVTDKVIVEKEKSWIQKITDLIFSIK